MVIVGKCICREPRIDLLVPLRELGTANSINMERVEAEGLQTDMYQDNRVQQGETAAINLLVA